MSRQTNRIQTEKLYD